MVWVVRDRGIAWRRNERTEKSEGQLPMFTAGLPSCASANLFVRKALFTWKGFLFEILLEWQCCSLQGDERAFQGLIVATQWWGNSLWSRAVAEHGLHIVTAALMPGLPDPLSKLGGEVSVHSAWWGDCQENADRCFVFDDDRLPDVAGYDFYPWGTCFTALFT